MYKYILLFLNLSILFILLNNTINIETYENNNYYNSKFYLNYRLGDIVNGYLRENVPPTYFKSQKLGNKTPEIYYSKFRNTIAGEYLTKTDKLPKNKQNNNYDILYQIIKKKKKDLILPDKSEIIIHLRVGDVIKYSTNQKSFDDSNPRCTKIETITKISKIFQNQKLVFVYGIHVNVNHKPTELYLDKIKSILKKNNNKFKFLNSKNPDLDFIYMCYSKSFIKAGRKSLNHIGELEHIGGFTKIISDIIKYINNYNFIYDYEMIDKIYSKIFN